MFGIRYMKTSPTQFVLHYHNGHLRRSGTGLAFFYYAPASSIAIVPISSTDVPFIFNEISADFQPLTVQGQLTYRIKNPERIASLLDFTVIGSPPAYLSDDPGKLPQRLVNLAQVLTRSEIEKLPLRRAMHASDEVSRALLEALHSSAQADEMGVEVLSMSIQAIRPTPESARALEAEAREALLRQSDQAIYDRRNASVDQERRIKENELNTEIAVEEKKRKIRETRVEADLAVETREQQVREARLSGQIHLEEEKAQLVAAQSENVRKEADDQAYAIEASLRPLRELDAEVLQMLSVHSAEPRLIVSLALKEIARNAAKIGTLNISPDLLESLMQSQKTS